MTNGLLPRPLLAARSLLTSSPRGSVELPAPPCANSNSLNNKKTSKCRRAAILLGSCALLVLLAAFSDTRAPLISEHRHVRMFQGSDNDSEPVGDSCATDGREDNQPLCSVVGPTNYTLRDEYSGADFLKGWGFWSAKDPQKGVVNYRTREDAADLNLTYHDASSGSFYLQPDLTNRLKEGENRDSVRIETTRIYKYGLFVLDADHMPTGCGTWPAFWMYDFPWPESGEIDIMEGVNSATTNRVALHTSATCAMDPNESNSFTGNWDKGLNGQPGVDCDVKAPDQKPNVGCGIEHPNSYGSAFNSKGGGVYAAEWDASGVRIWYFARGCIPPDLLCGRPDPARNWGKPAASYSFGPRCSTDRLDYQHIVINLTFCGIWGERDFAGQGCRAHGVLTCPDLVRNRPDVLKDAYWKIRSVTVYQTPQGMFKDDAHVGPHPGMK